MGRNRALGSPYQAETVAASFQTLADVDMYCVSALGGGVVATLDPNAFDGDRVVIQDIANVAGTEPITVIPSAGQTILDGFGGSYAIAANGGGALFTFSFARGGWIPEGITLAALTANATTNGGAPSIAALADAGTGATATLSSNATDTAGQITLNTGTGSGSGAQLTVTFAAPFAAAPRSVVFFSANALSADSFSFFVASTATTGFTMDGVPLDASQYVWNYIVIG